MPIKPILAHLPNADTSVTLLLNVMCATHCLDTLFALSTVLVMIEENPHDWFCVIAPAQFFSWGLIYMLLQHL